MADQVHNPVTKKIQKEEKIAELLVLGLKQCTSYVIIKWEDKAEPRIQECFLLLQYFFKRQQIHKVKCPLIRWDAQS